MVDLEDARLLRVAERRFRITAHDVLRTLEAVERAADCGERACVVRELERRGALPDGAAHALLDLRDRARPNGLKLVSRLGRGASATVYVAREPDGAEVALKLFAGTARDEARAATEAWALARCDHPSIPRLLGQGDVQGRRFLVLERVPGPTLRELVKSRGALPWPTVVVIGSAVARALAHAHRRGVLHRDVKPANVILSARGASLVDFGLACPTGERAKGRVVGTPGFLSPEQARGDDADERSDVFALGALLYNVLTTRLPFDADGAEDAIAAAADPTRETRPLRDVRPGLPARLVDLVDAALARDPARRPATAGEVHSRLLPLRIGAVARSAAAA